MQNQPTLRQTIITNLLWFAASLILAFFVWLLAVSQSDPFEQWRLSERVPIRLTPDAGLIITNEGEFPAAASLQMQAQRSVHQVFAADDVVVYADLAGLGPGEHTVPLEWSVARHATVVNLTPRQITVELELKETQLKPANVEIISQPPLIYSIGTPELDVPQVEVSGPASRVAQVIEVRAPVALDGRRMTYEDDIRLVPVDVDGSVVNGVTLNPQTVHVRIPIQARSDVREVSVQPNIIGQLAEGYILTGFDYNPRSIVVSGPAAVLANLPGTFFTAPIDLSDKTNSFEVTVSVELPDARLVAVTGRTATVRVDIDTQTVTRQFEHIPVEMIGVRSELEYQTVTREVTVLVTGPQPLLNQLTESDLSVLVNVSALDAGESAQIAPVASIMDSETIVTTAVLPALIDVQVASEATAEPLPG